MNARVFEIQIKFRILKKEGKKIHWITDVDVNLRVLFFQKKWKKAEK